MLRGGYVAGQRRGEEFLPSGNIKRFMVLTVVLESGESTIVEIPAERYKDTVYVEEQVQETIDAMVRVRDLHLSA